jgi:hypothetical protein
MTVSPQCKPLLDRKRALETEREEVWADLQEAIADGNIALKFRLAKRAGDLSRMIVGLQAQYEQCEIKVRGLKPLDAMFSGNYTFRTNVAFTDITREGALKLLLHFNERRTTLGIPTFPDVPISGSGAGVNVTGHMDMENDRAAGYYRNGQIDVPTTLQFYLSVNGGSEERSDLPTRLSSLPPGSPVQADGSVTLFGSGTFSGGFLHTRPGEIRLVGKISPHP